MSIVSAYSCVSSEYKAFRPSYPVELFEFIATLTPGHDLAWDVATGSGQAAVNLSKFYRRVKASDLCAEQISEAPKLGNVEYFCLPAELSEDECRENDFEPNSFDLITCATAIHWIDTEKFFALAKRSLKPSGVMAILQYRNPPIFDDENIDRILREYRQKTEPLVHYSIKNVTEETYKQMNFPFVDLVNSWSEGAKQFQVVKQYSLSGLQSLLDSWSLTVLAKEKWGGRPAQDIVELIKPHWGSASERSATYHIFYRVGKNA